MTERAAFKLDLRGTKCPLNFVKTKLFLEKIQSGDLLDVLLDEGEPAESVLQGIEAEGHAILGNSSQLSGYCRVSIRKV